MIRIFNTIILVAFWSLLSCSNFANKNQEQVNIVETDRISEKLFCEEKDISDPTNTLNGKTETLKLKYIVWGCVCANWITPADFEKYQDSALSEHCIFIEPASEDLELPLNFDPFEQFIQVTGQFYIKPDYPKGTMQGEQQPLNKAKVFRYTKIEVVD